MIRRLLRRLFGPSGDIYIVIDTGYVHTMIVGVSARQQGAERMRAAHAARMATLPSASDTRNAVYQRVYDRTIIENHELQDTE